MYKIVIAIRKTIYENSKTFACIYEIEYVKIDGTTYFFLPMPGKTSIIPINGALKPVTGGQATYLYRFSGLNL
jgi:hypothetical protein